MKKRFVCIGLLLLLVVAVSANDVLGKWYTFDEVTKKTKSEVEIYQVDGLYFCKVVNVFNRPAGEGLLKCTECTGKKKDLPIIGLVVIENMKKEGKEYVGGTLTDPKNGKEYTCKFFLLPNDSQTLEVRGYVGIFSRGQHWKRAAK